MAEREPVGAAEAMPEVWLEEIAGSHVHVRRQPDLECDICVLLAEARRARAEVDALIRLARSNVRHADALDEYDQGDGGVQAWAMVESAAKEYMATIDALPRHLHALVYAVDSPSTAAVDRPEA